MCIPNMYRVQCNPIKGFQLIRLSSEQSDSNEDSKHEPPVEVHCSPLVQEILMKTENTDSDNKANSIQSRSKKESCDGAAKGTSMKSTLMDRKWVRK